jgi:hypothetical protein
MHPLQRGRGAGPGPKRATAPRPSNDATAPRPGNDGGGTPPGPDKGDSGGVPAADELEDWVGYRPADKDLGGGGGVRNLLNARILDFIRAGRLIAPSASPAQLAMPASQGLFLLAPGLAPAAPRNISLGKKCCKRRLNNLRRR